MSNKISKVIFMGKELLPHVKDKQMQKLLNDAITKLAIVYESNNDEVNSKVEKEMKEPLQVIENLYNKYATN